MANKSGIHIKESHKGEFTRKAKKAGMSVSKFASKEAHNPDASAKTKKQAVFAENAKKWHHGEKYSRVSHKKIK